MFVGKYKGYDIYVSDRPNKKYYAMVKGRKVHFGSRFHQQYKDKMGYYSSMDHKDIRRKNLFYLRHGKNAEEGTPLWFASKILW